MKKLLLLAAGALMGLSASAQWAVVGSYTTPNWNFDASTHFEGEGEVLSCTIAKLTPGFKIVDITNNNWDIQYGTSTPVDINTPYVLDGKNGGDDPANIVFAGLIQEINNATLTWNPTTYTLEIKAQESDVVKAYPALYMTGSFNDWPTPGNGAANEVAGTENNGVYTFNVNLGENSGATFKVATTNWGLEFAGKTSGVVIGTEPVEVQQGGSDLVAGLSGEQTLIFNYDELTMYFVDNTTGVKSISVENAAKVYYNLQGVRVANPVKGNIYIVNGKKVVF